MRARRINILDWFESLLYLFFVLIYAGRESSAITSGTTNDPPRMIAGSSIL